MVTQLNISGIARPSTCTVICGISSCCFTGTAAISCSGNATAQQSRRLAVLATQYARATGSVGQRGYCAAGIGCGVHCRGTGRSSNNKRRRASQRITAAVIYRIRRVIAAVGAPVEFAARIAQRGGNG